MNTSQHILQSQYYSDTKTDKGKSKEGTIGEHPHKLSSEQNIINPIELYI